MQFHTLKRKTPNKKSKMVGRGGTRGKTSGRGTKGQNARAGRKKRPELRDFIKRVPKLRGRGKSSLKSFQPKLAGQALQKKLAAKS
ncbi:MAG: uL15 family ribosomal protein [bacterium]|nr:uL15 family ribosomal protein [bacterium]